MDTLTASDRLVAAGVLLSALLLLAGALLDPERGALDLAPAERAAVHACTHPLLQTACEVATDDTCHREAELFARTPTCDAECRRLLARFTPRPTK